MCKKRKKSHIPANISAERRPKSEKFRKQEDYTLTNKALCHTSFSALHKSFAHLFRGRSHKFRPFSYSTVAFRQNSWNLFQSKAFYSSFFLDIKLEMNASTVTPMATIMLVSLPLPWFLFILFIYALSSLLLTLRINAAWRQSITTFAIGARCMIYL